MKEEPVQIKIHPHNKPVYLDIARDMLLKGNGLFSFTVQISSGMIVNYLYMEGGKYVKTVQPK
jgi:hypothetical protein